MAYDEILYEAGDGIATVTLNRPEKLNAWTPIMEDEVRNAIKRATTDDAIRVVVLTGAGRGFCSGADIGQLGQLGAGTARPRAPHPNDDAWPTEVRSDYRSRYSYFLAVPKPIIAAVNGPCAGIGLVIALYCDLRFASADAVITTAFSRRGLIAEQGISWLLPALVGPSAALDLLLSARKVGAEEALGLGLVNRVASGPDLLAMTYEYARDLCKYVSPRSMTVIKRQLWEAQFQTLGEAISLAQDEQRTSFQSDDFREGIAHFRERREPKFSGR